MKVRFLADYDFNGEILDGVVRREPSIDFLSGFEAGLEGVPDPDVLDPPPVASPRRSRSPASVRSVKIQPSVDGFNIEMKR
jgi:hypothetical protein